MVAGNAGNPRTVEVVVHPAFQPHKASVGGVPPGEVTVTAFLPATGAQASSKVKLLPNASRRVDFTLKFDASKLKAAEPADPGAADAATAAAPISD